MNGLINKIKYVTRKQGPIKYNLLVPRGIFLCSHKTQSFWFSKALPIVKDIWNTILKERVDGYEHRAAKKRSTSIVLASEDGDTKHIRTDSQKNSICLVKLDF